MLLKNKTTLKDKVVLVTGASRGIGRAIALELARNGAKVIVNYTKSEKEAMEVVEQIIELGKQANNDNAPNNHNKNNEAINENKTQAMALHADVSNYKEVQEMFAIIHEKFGKIDILVNNAGILRDRTLKNMSLDEWHSVININLNGVFYCCKEALAETDGASIINDNGRIINISSIVGVTGNFGQSNYAAAKAGVIGFTKSLALELKKRKITVNAIIPGLVETDMTKDLIKRGLFEGITVRKQEEVAKKVLYLCSDEAKEVAGEIVNLDYG